MSPAERQREQGRERTRRYRQRRGRSRPRDVAYMVSVPVTFADVDALDRLRLLPGGRSDKAAVTAAVRELWASLEVRKNM